MKDRPSMKVPLLDLKLQYDRLRERIESAVRDVLESQAYCNGPAVRELETAIAAYCGAPTAIGLSSGTDALLVALMALQVGPGDEVIVPTFTFFATAGVVGRLGARPVLVDIEAETFNIDPAAVANAVSDRTRAIIPVHLVGQCAEMDPIVELASDRGIAVIEDAAQAIGSTHRGRRAGAIGDVGCFSFYPTKNLGGLGDGGMAVTADADLGRRIALLRTHGEDPRYFHKLVGGNFRMDSIQAAALRVKLEHLDGWSAARRANAARYDALLAEAGDVVTPTVLGHNVSIYNQYVIRAPRRDALQKHLADAGIGSGVYYPLCLHQQECFASLGHQAGEFPVAERAAAEVLALPIFPELSGEQIEYVADRIKAFYR
jgi:dTDP-4-amino-4,6-dideoxygalactose transaminase